MRVGYDQGTAIISGILVLGRFDTSPAQFGCANRTPPMLVLMGFEPPTGHFGFQFRLYVPSENKQ